MSREETKQLGKRKKKSTCIKSTKQGSHSLKKPLLNWMKQLKRRTKRFTKRDTLENSSVEVRYSQRSEVQLSGINSRCLRVK